MKRFFKTFISLLLVAVMSLSVGMLAACTEEPQPQPTESSTPDTSNGSNPGQSSGGGETAEADTVLTPENRADYSMMNAAAVIANTSVYDFLMAMPAQNSVFSLLEGYRAGDFYDYAIDMLAMMAMSSEESFQMNFEVFKFTRNEDGNWHNSYGADVHPVLNALLNYQLDGSEELALTENDVTNFGNASVKYLLVWSLTNSEIVVGGKKQNVGDSTTNLVINNLINNIGQMHPVINATLNAKLKDVAAIFSGDMTAAMNIYGALTLGEMMPEEEMPEGRLGEVFAPMTVAEAFALSMATPEEQAAFVVENFGDLTLGNIFEDYILEEAYENEYLSTLMAITVEELFAIASSEEYAEAFMMAKFGDFTLEDIYGEQIPEEVKENPIIADLMTVTVRELAAIKDSEDEDAMMAFVMERYGKFTLDDLFEGMFAELAEAMPEEFGMTELIAGLGAMTIAEAFEQAAFYAQNGGEATYEEYYKESAEEAFATFTALTVEDMVGILGLEVSEEFEGAFDAVKDLTIGQFCEAVADLFAQDENVEGEEEQGEEAEQGEETEEGEEAYKPFTADELLARFMTALAEMKVFEYTEENEGEEGQEFAFSMSALDIFLLVADFGTSYFGTYQAGELTDIDSVLDVLSAYIERNDYIFEPLFYSLDKINSYTEEPYEEGEVKEGEVEEGAEGGETEEGETATPQPTIYEYYQMVKEFASKEGAWYETVCGIIYKNTLTETLTGFAGPFEVGTSGIAYVDGLVQKYLAMTPYELYEGYGDMVADFEALPLNVTLGELMTLLELPEEVYEDEAFAALIENYAEMTLQDAYDAVIAAVTDLPETMTINALLAYLPIPEEIAQNEAFAEMIEKFGEYKFSEFNEEDLEELKAYLEALAATVDAEDFAGEEGFELPKTGIEGFDNFVAALIAMSAEEMENGALAETLKNVTVEEMAMGIYTFVQYAKEALNEFGFGGEKTPYEEPVYGYDGDYGYQD